MSNKLSPLSGPVDASGEPPRGQMLGEGARALETVTGIWQFTRRLTDAERDALRRYIIKQGGGILSESNEAAAVPSSPAQEEEARCQVCGALTYWKVDRFHCHTCGHENGTARLVTKPAPPSSPVADSPTRSILVDRDADVRREMRAYLDTLTIHGDNIGDIRRSLFVPYPSQWNGWVREDTAERELPAPSPSAGAAKENN